MRIAALADSRAAVRLGGSVSLRADAVDRHRTEAFRKPCKQVEGLSEDAMWVGAAGTGGCAWLH